VNECIFKYFSNTSTCIYSLFLGYIIYYALDLFFLNPFTELASLTAKEENLIRTNLPFYKKLSEANKKKFKKRLIRFRSRKNIVFHEDVEKQEDIILLLSATVAMLTLGMRDFMVLSIERIIIYPTEYYSQFTRQNHYGEYNPGLKIAVFSAEHLLHGFKIPNDNINLAVHEFAHAISFNVMNKNSFASWSFTQGLRKLKRMYNSKIFMQELKDTSYFRAYGRTNIHEFFAVAAENYIETPTIFKRDYPDLYRIMNRMLNFDFNT